MTRTVSAVVSAAVAQDATQPIYLIRMGWALSSPDVNRRIATWAADITWNSETWSASGADVRSLSPAGGTLLLPNGDTDPWLGLVSTEVARGRTIDIYEYHTSTASPAGSDATQLFSGLMDAVDITPVDIVISFIDNLLNKRFPPTSITPSVYTELLSAGQRLYWGPDVVMIEE
jgi:hypothetical protein